MLSASPHNDAWAKVKIFVDDGIQFIVSLCSSTIGVNVDWHWRCYANCIGNLEENNYRLPALYWILGHIKAGSNQMGRLFSPLSYDLLDHPSQAPEGRVNVVAVMFTCMYYYSYCQHSCIHQDMPPMCNFLCLLLILAIPESGPSCIVQLLQGSWQSSEQHRLRSDPLWRHPCQRSTLLHVHPIHRKYQQWSFVL